MPLNAKEGSFISQRPTHLIGLLTATTPACLPVPLHYRGLQTFQHRALSNLNLMISRSSWTWMQPRIFNFGPNKPTNGMEWKTNQFNWDLTITSDVSTLGMGGGGSCGASQMGSPWTVEEAQTHINLMELRKAFQALQTYASQFNNQHIHCWLTITLP